LNPACRLLTLVGPGGIGKTRLALEVAQQFPNAHFVALQPLASADFIVSAMAESLNFQFYSGSDPKQQLFDYLREKSWLVVLDNFEHLLDGATLLSEILTAAPAVRMLVTSRERLNLLEEWVLDVGGLAYPASEADPTSEQYSAIKLFVQHARRVNTAFRVTEAQRPAVIRICRLVGGMPLGIELAASWVRALSCEAIAGEIERSLDILETPARNVEPRHRTMRAAFAPTWERLSDRERDVFMKLSVFRGGFTREAAAAVAGTTLRTLSALVDKSLLRVSASGRYDLHELLRQYAAEKLNESGDSNTTSQRHLSYFLYLAEQAEAHQYGREQPIWYDRVEIELNNVRTALAWSLQSEEVEIGLRLAGALNWFFHYRGHWAEGRAWLEVMAALGSEADASARAKALHSAGELSIMLGDEYRAEQLCREALALARQCNDKWNIAWALGTLATCLEDKRALDVMINLLDESLALFQELDDAYGQSHLLRRRAWRAIDQRDYSNARLMLEEAITRAEEVGDLCARAWALYELGAVSWLGDHQPEQTIAMLLESSSLFRESGSIAEACIPLILLARVEKLAGNALRAQMLYHEVLVRVQGTRVFENQPGSILFPGLGSLAAMQSHWEMAAKLLAAGERCIPGDFGFFPRAEFDRDVASVRAQLGGVAFAADWAVGKAMTTEQVIAYALQEVSPPTHAMLVERVDDAETMRSGLSRSQPANEGLTDRELNILRLIANGCSNGEIADQLVLATSTVKWYAHQIFEKLEVSSRTQAVAQARIHGLIT